MIFCLVGPCLVVVPWSIPVVWALSEEGFPRDLESLYRVHQKQLLMWPIVGHACVSLTPILCICSLLAYDVATTWNLRERNALLFLEFQIMGCVRVT